MRRNAPIAIDDSSLVAFFSQLFDLAAGDSKGWCFGQLGNLAKFPFLKLANTGKYSGSGGVPEARSLASYQ